MKIQNLIVISKLRNFMENNQKSILIDAMAVLVDNFVQSTDGMA